MHHTSNTVYIHIHGKERTFCQRDAVKSVENKLVYENNATMTYHGKWSHRVIIALVSTFSSVHIPVLSRLLVPSLFQALG